MREISVVSEILKKLRLRSRVTAMSCDLVHGFCSESDFRKCLTQERKRAERSSKPLLVMTLDVGHICSVDGTGSMSRNLCNAIRAAVRETDICGLLNEGASLGVILTEIACNKVKDAQAAVAGKVKERIAAILEEEALASIRFGFRVYPEAGGEEGAFDPLFYPEVECEGLKDLLGPIIKRGMDLFGSSAGLLLLSPVFVVVSVTIKLTSAGPVFFLQERVGQNGKCFKFAKFRTMFTGNDDGLHREFVKQLIEGKLSKEETPVFKLTTDPRITRIGRVLRKYSIDELPQLYNVLTGDMSLVGPRPPICYELEHYSGWQRNRLVGKRPGITGSWQVGGRSSTSFDEMVRLDLRYLKEWSVMLDLKILLQTPMAVFRCRGAY